MILFEMDFGELRYRAIIGNTKKKAELSARVGGNHRFQNLILELHVSLGDILKCHTLNLKRNKK